MPRTPIRSPPVKKLKNEALAPKSLTQDFDEATYGGNDGSSTHDDEWKSDSRDSWRSGHGWYWSQYSYDEPWGSEWQNWRYNRQYSWQEYRQPVQKTLLARKETALPDPRSEGEVDDEMPGLQPVFEEPAEGGEQAPKAKVEPRVEPKVEPPPQKPSKRNPAENGKSWNTDKFGKILNGKALYQRFYRSIRSPLACNKKPAAA